MPQLLARNLAILLAIRKVVDGCPTRLQDADGQHLSIFHRAKSSKYPSALLTPAQNQLAAKSGGFWTKPNVVSFIRCQPLELDYRIGHLEVGGRPRRAILRTRFGGPEKLVIREIPEPEPKGGHAVIEVKAFGLNHAELHMRKGEWAEIADVSGIECVGVVKSCPGGEFAVGTKVAALMGGLGRTINGSYAEYTRAPVTNVASIESGLSWADLAAIPETYATAWTCLFRNLEVTKNQTLVIRGATSTFGQAALNRSRHVRP